MTKLDNKSSWLNLINIENVYSAENQRRAFTFFTMIFVALVLITSLVVSNHDVYPIFLTVMLVVSDITLLLFAWYFYKTGRFLLVTVTVLSIICVLCLALVYTGGKENTALYWVMFYPVVAFSTLGFRIGFLIVSLLLILSSFLLFGPDIGQVNYPETEKGRFFAAFSLVFLFSFIGEYFRNKSHLEIARMTLSQKQDAHRDHLTGLANRRFIISHFLPIARTHADKYLPMCLLLIDLDHFKEINDTHGHDIGDNVLVGFASLLEEHLRAQDIKVRYGGEEFLVILPGIGLPAAAKVALLLKEQVNKKSFAYEDNPLNMSCSIGVSEVIKIKYFNDALKLADDRLYSAKNNGRNCVVFSGNDF
jgi:diguanylate cyclase (GGDEF)-like protein